MKISVLEWWVRSSTWLSRLPPCPNLSRFRYIWHTITTHPSYCARLSTAKTAAESYSIQMSSLNASIRHTLSLLRPWLKGQCCATLDEQPTRSFRARCCFSKHSSLSQRTYRSGHHPSNHGTPRPTNRIRLWACDPSSAAKSRAESESAVHLHHAVRYVLFRYVMRCPKMGCFAFSH